MHSFFAPRDGLLSRSLSSGAHSRDPVARNDGCVGASSAVIVGWAKRSVPTILKRDPDVDGGHGARAPLPTLRNTDSSSSILKPHPSLVRPPPPPPSAPPA